VKLTLEHRIERPVAEVWAMLRDPDSHVAKFAGMGHRDIEVVSSSVTETSLDLTLRRQVDMDVPAVAAKLLQPTNTVTSVDHWSRTDDGSLTGRYEVAIKGVPAETRGVTSVVADGDDACTYAIELDVKVKVPLVGDRIAKALRPQIEAQVLEEFAAADSWLSLR
jgi:carbon monoxide dehydrogenase subunit G